MREPNMGVHAFTGSFHHDPSVPYMSSFTRPSPPILSQSLPPYLYPSQPPPPPSSSSSSSSSTSSSSPSLSPHLLSFHSSYRLPPSVNDYIVGHVVGGSPHRHHHHHVQQWNSSNPGVGGVREFPSGCASGETMGYYQVQGGGSWGYQDEQQVGPSSINRFQSDF